jgi:hypothetical protein
MSKHFLSLHSTFSVVSDLPLLANHVSYQPQWVWVSRRGFVLSPRRLHTFFTHASSDFILSPLHSCVPVKDEAQVGSSEAPICLSTRPKRGFTMQGTRCGRQHTESSCCNVPLHLLPRWFTNPFLLRYILSTVSCDASPRSKPRRSLQSGL